jgi:hypothetical protein
MWMWHTRNTCEPFTWAWGLASPPPQAAAAQPLLTLKVSRAFKPLARRSEAGDCSRVRSKDETPWINRALRRALVMAGAGQNGMFNNSNSVYEGGSDGPRFDFFCKAALEFMLTSARQPDIIHCHDWSTAMAAKFLWEDYHNAGLWKPRVAFTIHNLEFGQAKIGDAMYNAQVGRDASPRQPPIRHDTIAHLRLVWSC